MDTAGGKGAHEGREFVLIWSCCSARAASAPPCMADVNFPNEAGLWNACVQWESSKAARRTCPRGSTPLRSKMALDTTP